MAILAVGGRKGSGKDLVGQIFQYVYDCDLKQRLTATSEKDFREYIKYNHHLKCRWQIKKFADKLKDMVCLLIGCTREQLEDQEFKETPLGDEWDNITPRLILQKLGTEGVRDTIHQNAWVNSLMSEYKLNRHYFSDIANGREGDKSLYYPNWIITDTRFPNEMKAVEDRGGVKIRINRPNLKSNTQNEHSSETALDDFKDWDYVIDNDGTVGELIQKVKSIYVALR